MESSKITTSNELSTPLVLCLIPKCGTHLLENIIRKILSNEAFDEINEDGQLPSVDGSYIYAKDKLQNKIYRGHLWFSKSVQEKLKNIPKVILIRDPRDYVISHKHFLDYFRGGKGKLDNYVSKLENNNDKLSSIILGLNFHDAILSPVYEHFQNFGLKWIDDNSLVVRYEDLIIRKSGRVEERTVKTVETILDLIGLKYSNLEQFILDGSNPSRSPTFRSGKIGDWKKEFSDFTIEQMKICAPNLVSALGYESDENWNMTSNLEEPKKINMNQLILPDHPDKIFERYENLLKLSQNSSHTIYMINCWAAKQFIEIGKFGDAISILVRLLNNNPSDPLWNYHMAFCLHQCNNDLQTALKHYNLALENGFDEFWVKFNRGLLLLQMNERHQARIDLERAYSLHPDHPNLEQLVKNTLKSSR